MNRFRKIYIEITNVCNLRCSFCPVNKRPPGFMSPVLFKNILNEIKDFTQYVYLHVKGEPLLHPDLSELLDICHSYQINAVLVTNGTLLKAKGDMLLSKPSLKQVNISLHCYTELNRLLGKDDYLAQIVEFTRLALEKEKLNVSLKLWNYNRESGETSPENHHILEVIERGLAPGTKLISTFKAGSRVKLTERLYLNSDYEFIWPDLQNSLLNTTGYCYALRDHIAILTDGTVVPCCLDADGVIGLGNIFHDKLSEIIASERATTMFKGFSNNFPEEMLCRKCGFISKFSNK